MPSCYTFMRYYKKRNSELKNNSERISLVRNIFVNKFFPKLILKIYWTQTVEKRFCSIMQIITKPNDLLTRKIMECVS